MEHCLTEHTSSSPEETEAIGRRLARCLKPGMIIALKGTLGAGKTCLTKGIASGLGITENITSPTYTIISEYHGTIPLYHIDAYRLHSDDDFESTGAGEYLGGQGVAIVEWPERIPASIPKDAVSIQVVITGPQNRTFRIEGIDLP
jgi:tRNA threonylcarbamoyladenosine biosynthesis protein TsaE